MPLTIGLVLSLGVAAFARCVGLDRERAFYSTVLIVVASYYVLFAAMSGSSSAMTVELIVMAGFVASAVFGFRFSRWLIVAGLAGHGVFDAFHGYVIANPGVPAWWPAFCGSYDIGAALWLALLYRWDAIRRASSAVGADGGAVTLRHRGHPI